MLKLFIFCVFLCMALLASPIVFDMMQDPCDAEYLHTKIEKRLERNAKKPHLKDTFKSIKQKIKTLNIPKEKEQDAIIAFAKYAALTQRNCTVPTDIKKDFFLYALGHSDTGTKHCPVNTFKRKAQQRIALMKQYPKMRVQVEQQALKLLTKEVERNPKVKNYIAMKWKNHDYKNAFMLAALQASMRKKSNCSGSNAPIIPFMEDIMKHALQE